MQWKIIVLVIALCFMYILWYQLKTIKHKYQTVTGLFDDYLEHDIVYKYQLVPDKGFVYLSGAVTQILGYTPADHYKNPQLVFELVHPEDKSKLEDIFTNQADVSEPVLLRFISKNGDIVWLEKYATPEYDTNGELIAIEGICRDITKRKLIEESLEYKVLHDPLTGVYSRAYFEQMLERMGREQQSVALIVCDLDNLKQLNDTLGHLAGDRLLKSAAKILECTFAGQGTIARIGGDEFAVLLSGITKRKLNLLIDKVEENIKDYNYQTPQLLLSMSIGSALCRRRNKDMLALFKEADTLMYKQKCIKKGAQVSNLSSC